MPYTRMQAALARRRRRWRGCWGHHSAAGRAWGCNPDSPNGSQHQDYGGIEGGAIGLEVIEHDTGERRAQAGAESEANLHETEDLAEMPPLKEIGRGGAVNDARTAIAQSHEHHGQHHAPGVSRGLRREQA